LRTEGINWDTLAGSFGVKEIVKPWLLIQNGRSACAFYDSCTCLYLPLHHQFLFVSPFVSYVVIAHRSVCVYSELIPIVLDNIHVVDQGVREQPASESRFLGLWRAAHGCFRSKYSITNHSWTHSCASALRRNWSATPLVRLSAECRAMNRLYSTLWPSCRPRRVLTVPLELRDSGSMLQRGTWRWIVNHHSHEAFSMCALVSMN
jgi:hypothetical protein